MDLTLLADGYAFLEAPRIGADGIVYFSDVILGGVYRLWPDGTIDAHLPGRRWIGGIALNQDGALIVSGEGGFAILQPR